MAGSSNGGGGGGGDGSGSGSSGPRCCRHARAPMLRWSRRGQACTRDHRPRWVTCMMGGARGFRVAHQPDPGSGRGSGSGDGGSAGCRAAAQLHHTARGGTWHAAGWHAVPQGSTHLGAVVQLELLQQRGATGRCWLRYGAISHKLVTKGTAARGTRGGGTRHAARASRMQAAVVVGAEGASCVSSGGGGTAGAGQVRQAGVRQAHAEGEVQAAQEGQARHLAQPRVCAAWHGWRGAGFGREGQAAGTCPAGAA